MSNNIEDLRARLFATLDGLADREKPMEINRAKAIADVARVIVDSAKAEIQLLHVTGRRDAATKFIPTPVGPAAGQRRIAGPTAGGCSHCGGRLIPETNGGGSVIDRCTDCGRSPEPSPRRANATGHP